MLGWMAARGLGNLAVAAATDNPVRSFFGCDNDFQKARNEELASAAKRAGYTSVWGRKNARKQVQAAQQAERAYLASRAEARKLQMLHPTAERAALIAEGERLYRLAGGTQ
jgi:hypothetical protein